MTFFSQITISHENIAVVEVKASAEILSSQEIVYFFFFFLLVPAYQSTPAVIG